MILELGIILFVFLFAAATPLIFPSLMLDMIGHILGNRPNDYEGWTYYGGLLIRAGRHEEAVTALVKAVTLRPDYSKAWEKLGYAYTMTGDSERAAEAYRLAADDDRFLI
ncbi:MAG: tetratricopeptide repeat protein [Candidatus Thorarchaeota archaeon]